MFSSEANYESERGQAISKKEMPEWASKIMVWEVSLWRKIWLLAREFFAGKWNRITNTNLRIFQ